MGLLNKCMATHARLSEHMACHISVRHTRGVSSLLSTLRASFALDREIYPDGSKLRISRGNLRRPRNQYTSIRIRYTEKQRAPRFLLSISMTTWSDRAMLYSRSRISRSSRSHVSADEFKSNVSVSGHVNGRDTIRSFRR